ncbi:MAG: hypothetical protein MI784_12940 [Cytophagales bacterium]|nr:hypothetical protein [Cytophagales bacterium]
MRLPSFIKLPRHSRFEIEPRHYDPIKEEIEERTEKIKRELELRKKGQGGRRINISKAYKKKEREDLRSSLGMFFLVFVLGATAFGYLYIQEHAETILWMGGFGLALYLYFRIKGIF